MSALPSYPQRKRRRCVWINAALFIFGCVPLGLTVFNLVWVLSDSMQFSGTKDSPASLVARHGRVPMDYNRSNPTLILQLRGEMGNHLSAIAHGMGVKWYARERFGLDLQLLVRHQVLGERARLAPNTMEVHQDIKDNPKWKPTSLELKQCFPNLKNWNFERGASWMEYFERKQQLDEWLPLAARNTLDLINGRPWLAPSPTTNRRRDVQPIEERELTQALETFQEIWRKQDRPTHLRSLPASKKGRKGTSKTTDLISMPFLRSESLENTFVVDRFYDRLKELFRFRFDGPVENTSGAYHAQDFTNDLKTSAIPSSTWWSGSPIPSPSSSIASCCGVEFPRRDETVLHYRNFRSELSESTSNTTGLLDVSPWQTANVLLGHLQEGDKVAITSRSRDNDPRLNQHVEALRKRGIHVRVISGQTGIQDFCFLLRSQKEVVGNFLSTFAFWAGVLGRARSVRLYTLDSPALRDRTGTTSIFNHRFLYNWTNPTLQNRLKLQLIPQQ